MNSQPTSCSTKGRDAMNLERTTWKLGLIWASFRMIADMIGRTIGTTARLAILAGVLWWGWQKFGPILAI